MWYVLTAPSVCARALLGHLCLGAIFLFSFFFWAKETEVLSGENNRRDHRWRRIHNNHKITTTRESQKTVFFFFFFLSLLRMVITDQSFSPAAVMAEVGGPPFLEISLCRFDGPDGGTGSPLGKKPKPATLTP